MVDSRIYSVVIFDKEKCPFYGTFSNRKNLWDSLKSNINLDGAYIQGSKKKLVLNPITIANGFIGNGLTVLKDDEENIAKPFIKILMHTMNQIAPYFYKERDKENE